MVAGAGNGGVPGGRMSRLAGGAAGGGGAVDPGSVTGMVSDIETRMELRQERLQMQLERQKKYEFRKSRLAEAEENAKSFAKELETMQAELARMRHLADSSSSQKDGGSSATGTGNELGSDLETPRARQSKQPGEKDKDGKTQDEDAKEKERENETPRRRTIRMMLEGEEADDPHKALSNARQSIRVEDMDKAAALAKFKKGADAGDDCGDETPPFGDGTPPESPRTPEETGTTPFHNKQESRPKTVVPRLSVIEKIGNLNSAMGTDPTEAALAGQQQPAVAKDGAGAVTPVPDEGYVPGVPLAEQSGMQENEREAEAQQERRRSQASLARKISVGRESLPKMSSDSPGEGGDGTPRASQQQQAVSPGTPPFQPAPRSVDSGRNEATEPNRANKNQQSPRALSGNAVAMPPAGVHHETQRHPGSLAADVAASSVPQDGSSSSVPTGDNTKLRVSLREVREGGTVVDPQNPVVAPPAVRLTLIDDTLPSSVPVASSGDVASTVRPGGPSGPQANTGDNALGQSMNVQRQTSAGQGSPQRASLQVPAVGAGQAGLKGRASVDLLGMSDNSAQQAVQEQSEAVRVVRQSQNAQDLAFLQDSNLHYGPHAPGMSGSTAANHADADADANAGVSRASSAGLAAIRKTLGASNTRNAQGENAQGQQAQGTRRRLADSIVIQDSVASVSHFAERHSRLEDLANRLKAEAGSGSAATGSAGGGTGGSATAAPPPGGSAFAELQARMAARELDVSGDPGVADSMPAAAAAAGERRGTILGVSVGAIPEQPPAAAAQPAQQPEAEASLAPPRTTTGTVASTAPSKGILKGKLAAQKATPRSGLGDQLQGRGSMWVPMGGMVPLTAAHWSSNRGDGWQSLGAGSGQNEAVAERKVYVPDGFHVGGSATGGVVHTAIIKPGTTTIGWLDDESGEPVRSPDGSMVLKTTMQDEMLPKMFLLPAEGRAIGRKSSADVVVKVAEAEKVAGRKSVDVTGTKDLALEASRRSAREGGYELGSVNDPNGWVRRG